MMSRATEDLDLIRRDSAIPGLGLLLDSGQLLERIAPHPAFESVSDLDLDYVRYKPGMNCLGRYRLARNGEPAWAYAKAFSGESLAKLDKVRQLLDEDTGARPIVVLPDWGLFVSLYPHDLKLRSIVRLDDRALRERLFRRVFDKAERWLDSDLQILNYKPERRLVLRLRSANGETASLKFHTRREFERLGRIRKSLSAAPQVRTPGQIGQSRKHHCYAYEWIDGVTLRTRPQGGTALERDYREAGRLIARFHDIPLVREASHDAPRQQPSLASLARQLAFLVPDLTPDAHALAAGLQALDGELAETPRLIHGDFYDKQVIVSGSEFGLIDLDCAHPGDIHQDLACFLAHRERHVLSGTAPADGAGLQPARSFLEGYRDAGGHFSERRLSHWMAWHLLRLSHHPFRDRLPDWPDRTRAMVRRAARLLREESPTAQIATA